MINGIRRDDFFIPKIYSNSKFDNAIILIDNISSEGILTSRTTREDE